MVDKLFYCHQSLLIPVLSKFFGYLQAIGAGGLSIALENFLRARHLVSIIGPTIVGPRNIFELGGLQMAGKRYFGLGF